MGEYVVADHFCPKPRSSLTPSPGVSSFLHPPPTPAPAQAPESLFTGIPEAVTWLVRQPGMVYIPPMAMEETRAGHVAIIGLPNAGKSSLLNRFLGSKLSIVTAAAQTTRERIVGIDTDERSQIVFMDTPGLVTPAYLLHRSMLAIVAKTIAEADVVLLLLDGTRSSPEVAPEIAELLAAARSKLLVAINKVDVTPVERRSELERWALDHFEVRPLHVSAATSEGVGELRRQIVSRLPVSPFLYPGDDLSTQSVRFFVSELIREAVFEEYEEEIPYSTAVRVEEFRESDDPIYIRASVLVERASQKGILIGHRGAAIRELGARARAKIETFVGSHVYLDLWVKVLPRWRKSPIELQRLGFPVPEEARRNA